MLKQVLSFIILFALVWSANAQTGHTLTGTVTDAENGDPLMGVNIRIEGTATGTITDLDGTYVLEAAEGSRLVYSYIGYKSVNLTVGKDRVVDVKMSTDSEVMDEVIVVGYTSMKKRDVLGAVSTVSTKDLTAIPVSNTAQALQGRVAGVEITSATGAPGSGVSVRIRGTGSVNSSNDPLYIVDGIPVEDALNNISPYDIESITVLKDASSAAVYGSRSNNGVVLITTRKGNVKSKVQVNYRGEFGLQTHGKLIDMVNTSDYIKIYNEAATADNAGSAIKRPLLEGDLLNGLADVDHVASIFRTAPVFTQELSVSGGNDNTSYVISGSYFNQSGIIRNSGYERGTLRANVNSNVRKWLSVGVSMNGALANTRLVSSSGDGYDNSEGGSIVRYAMFRNPAIPITDANGNYVDLPGNYFGDSRYDSFFGDGYNPVALAENTDRKRVDETVLAKTYAIFTLPFDLKWTNNFGIDYRNSNYKVYNKTWGDNDRINNPNGLDVERNRDFDWTFNSVLEYRKVFGEKHSFNVLAGFEAIRNTGYTLSASDKDYPVWDKDLIYIGNGLATKENKQSKETEWAATLASFFGQASYEYDHRYSVSATLRRDGSSRFVGSNRWGTFYSVSAGWNIDQEAFMKEVDIISRLKLRAGYGSVGNQNIGVYAYSDRYSSNYNYPFGGTVAYGYALTQLGNRNLKWETSKQFNVGIDLELWKGAFAFSADFYNKVNNDMLMWAPVPPSVGKAQPSWINSGKVLNRGVDLEFMYRKIYKDGGFNVSLNAGFLKNEVLELDAPVQGGRVDHGIYATLTEVGYPIGSFFMYEMDGIFQNEGEILTSAYQGNDIKPGDVKFVDQDGNGRIDAADRVHVGSPIPKVTMGLNFSANWKGFDLGVFFQGAFGHKIYNQILHDSEGFYRGFPVTQRYFDHRWTGEGSTNEYPRASWKAKSNNGRVSTRFLEDASYLRLKNIQLGYTFNTKSWGIEKLRLYVSATNLLTFTGYSGFDPEMTVSANSSKDGDKAKGIDWGTYPVPITYTFGVNLTF